MPPRPATRSATSDVQEDGDDMLALADPEVSRLESHARALLQLCRRLSEENRSLREERRKLVDERAQLIEKNESARAKIEQMITRLKAMESAT